MENVYALVDHYYGEHTDADFVIPKDVIERYLRRKAWHGADDVRLKKIWTTLSLMLTYISELHLYGLESLSQYDYLELVYRYEGVDPSFSLKEKDVLALYRMVDDFFSYYMQSTDAGVDLHGPLGEMKESCYERGRFLMPKRRSLDDFYTALEHMDDISQEALDDLNTIMNQLMCRIQDFYRSDANKYDMNRAMQLYSGPDFPSIRKDGMPDDPSFRRGFWDYFLFDYHLLEEDDTPMHYFCTYAGDRINQSERDLMKDILRTKFTVFEITGILDDYATCRDMLREEEFVLPADDVFLTDDPDRLVFYGHIRKHGIVMLNYVSSLPATRKLRLRMKDELQRLYRFYQVQSPGADVDEFLTREAAAVHHVLQILANYAQLQVVPFESGTKPIPMDEEVENALLPLYPMVEKIADSLGFSIYAGGLLDKMLHDYAVKAGVEQTADNILDLALALPLTMSCVNGADRQDILESESMNDAQKKNLKNWMEKIEHTLDLQRYDPRYLTEEGYVAMLYSPV